MFYKVVIYKCYDGQKKLGHVIPNEDLLAMLRKLIPPWRFQIMSYWSQMYRRPTRTERLEVKNGEARFESLMAKKLSDRDRKFAESLKKQFEDGGKLSAKQIECVEKMEQRYSPAVTTQA
jgi:hypothetical protein